MLVKLPRQCSGVEIVELFKVASRFKEKPDKKWESEEFVDKRKIIYEPGSANYAIRYVGVRARSFFLRKKWGLFGEKVWKLNENLTFTLESLNLSYHYNEIEVTIEGLEDKDIFFGPHNSYLEDIRLQVERIIGNLYACLQPQHVESK